MRDDVKSELKGTAVNMTTVYDPAGPKGKRLWKVDLGNYGPVTPSPFFAQEKPGDPRGRPIEADSAAEAEAIFYRLHGIISSEHTPSVEELSPAEADELAAQAAKPRKRRGKRAALPALSEEVV